MEPSDLSVFKRLQGRMKWLTARQEVLAENVANANTPGYRARDIKAPSFGGVMSMMRPTSVTTVGGGMQTASAPGTIPIRSKSDGAGTREVREDLQVSLSGNSVDLEAELKKAADAALEYQTITHLYRKNMEFLRMAVQSNGG